MVLQLMIKYLIWLNYFINMESTKGEQVYQISLTEENRIDEGTYGDVYKIYSKSH